VERLSSVRGRPPQPQPRPRACASPTVIPGILLDNPNPESTLKTNPDSDPDRYHDLTLDPVCPLKQRRFTPCVYSARSPRGLHATQYTHTRRLTYVRTCTQIQTERILIHKYTHAHNSTWNTILAPNSEKVLVLVIEPSS